MTEVEKELTCETVIDDAEISAIGTTTVAYVIDEKTLAARRKSMNSERSDTA